MFDPTIYENLKVSLEGAVYECDLSGAIQVTGRQDRIELSAMSRFFSLAFRLNPPTEAEAEIRIAAGTADLAAEILELEHMKPGCSLEICFAVPVTNVENDCPRIGETVSEIWGPDYPLKQTLSFDCNDPAPRFRNQAVLSFNRKYGEEIIADFPRFVEHAVRTLRRFSET